jgi:hypothetical protein
VEALCGRHMGKLLIHRGHSRQARESNATSRMRSRPCGRVTGSVSWRCLRVRCISFVPLCPHMCAAGCNTGCRAVHRDADFRGFARQRRARPDAAAAAAAAGGG